MARVFWRDCRLRAAGIALLGASALVGCGGDSGGGGSSASPTPTPSVANTAPSFNSADSVTVNENFSGSFYTATASDPDGDAIAFDIVGGADAGQFSIAGGALSFLERANFDRFADANQDNVFEVTLRASDGKGGAALQTLQVTVKNSREGVAVTRIATGFDDPVGMVGFRDGTVLVAERGGQIWSVFGQNGTKALRWDLNLAPGRDLIDVAGFAAGGTVLWPVAMVQDANGIYLVTGYNVNPQKEIKVADGDPLGAAGTLAYTWNSEIAAQGQLLVAIGDPGGDRAQGSSGYGKVYLVDDPYVRKSVDEFTLVGRGLRQPTRIFDFVSGVLIADQGQSSQHELTQLPSADERNFGWPYFEGNTQVRSGAPQNVVAPEFVYAVGNGRLSGQGIRGGVIYDSSVWNHSAQVPSIDDRVVFGDVDGSILTVPLTLDPAKMENRTQDFLPDVGSIDSVVAIAKTFEGVLFILDADGEVFRVDPA